MIVKLCANYINDFYTQVNYKASEEKGFEILPGSTILENGLTIFTLLHYVPI